MSWMDALNKVGELTKNINLFQKRVDDLEKLAKEQSVEIIALRKELATLTTRVAVLEEARNSIGSDVKRALSEAILGWENDQLRKQLEEARRGSRNDTEGFSRDGLALAPRD